MIPALLLSFSLQAPDTTLRLPLRVHLLRSNTSEALSTTRHRASVDTMVAFANRIWQQAGIEWIVESVITEDGPGELLNQLIAGTVPVTRERLSSLGPKDNLLVPGWNLFLIRDFGNIAGGAFIPELSGAILAERGFGYELPANGRGGGTLAHELGHSLTLPHVPCDSTHDVMANACSVPGLVSRLTPEQAVIARRQAVTGRPAITVPSP